MSTVEQQLKIQEKKREMLFTKMQTLYDLYKKLPQNKDKISEFIMKARPLDTFRKEYIECADKINELSFQLKENFTPTFKDVESFDEMYFIVNDTFRKLESNKKVSSEVAVSSETNTKLQPIELPTFDGTPENWPIFYQLFKKLVHENENYSDVEKVTYLVTHLKNSAKSVCISISPTAENYKLILKALQNRFEDKRSLASTYFEKILNFKPLQEETEESLDNFLSKFVEPINALKQMDLNDLSDFLFLHLALKRLDSNTSKLFENNNRSKDDIPTFDSLVAFVSEQAKILQRNDSYKKQFNTKTRVTNSNPKTPAFSPNKGSNHFNYSLFAAEENKPSTSQTHLSKIRGCNLCSSQDTHALYLCPSFKNMKLDDRWNYAKENKICFNCLSVFHMGNSCKSKNGCQVQGCNKNHHSLLHRISPNASQNTFSNSSRKSADIQALCATDIVLKPVSQSTVLLATVSVLVEDQQGRTHEIRGILDSGSQSNFLTQKACRKLGLSLESSRSVVKGIGSSTLNVSAHTTLHFRSKIEPFHAYTLQTLVVERLSDKVPFSQISNSDVDIFKNLPLADKNFHVPGEIDFLLGAELWPIIIGDKKFMNGDNKPIIALETTLGYVIMGRATIDIETNKQAVCLFSQSSLNSLVEKFWSLEEVPERELYSAEDTACEKFFAETSIRNSNGTFTVRLPFQKSPELLGYSKEMCIAKFISLEHRLIKNTILNNLYASLLSEYVQDGTISMIGQITEVDDSGYYMPHHAVFRPSHPTTPLRIVFNASAPTSSSYSLNDLLFVGPKLHAEIFDVLINFRLFQFVLTTDIRRMFLQINVHHQDRKFQRFIWRFSPQDQLQVYEVNKVVFGNTSSPYLANRVVRLLASLERSRYPLAASVAERDMYIDDVATSVNTEQDLLLLYEQLVEMFASGGFSLTKWSSNSNLLMSIIPTAGRLFSSVDFDPEFSSKILGMQWSPSHDSFKCVINIKNLSCTKRNILGVSASIFDPLGLIAPVTLVAKLMIKQLWKLGIEWDETPPKTFVEKWEKFQNSLPLLNKVSESRHVGICNGAITNLVGFADSSEVAYGACIYVVTQFPGSLSNVKLLCAKSRIAPTKVMTIPRLELCAALLLSKLMNSVMNIYRTRHIFDNIFAYSDSKVVLHWVHSDPSKWKIFIGNRIAKIQENLSPQFWRHVPGLENPADVLSRGISPSGLLDHPLWFSGPSWLKNDISEWPNSSQEEKVEIPKIEKKVISLFVTEFSSDIFTQLIDRVSSFRKLLRITAFVFRFCKLSKSKTLFLEREEIKKATEFWIKRIQNQYFKDEISTIQKGGTILSNIRSLDPFLHEGILRVGGRLHNAPIHFDKKHPILLPSKEKFVDLLIDQYHFDLLHAGQFLLISVIRRKYWIISARSRIRSRIHKCNVCFRFRPKPMVPKMAPLPNFRVEPSYVFQRTGVDYAGPFTITLRHRGQRNLTKAYICLFICLSVKAVHLELASDLSSECFLAAFKRFLSRRGPCTFLLSDGGTNFIGARNQLNDLERLLSSSSFQENLGNELSHKGIEWKINPANAPWFGGIWEANIKSLKTHLTRVVGSQILTYEELNTTIVQIEAVMNSRPLCVLDNDPNSPSALTPSHFLNVGAILERFPTENLDEVPLNRLKRFQLVDRLVQDYWNRWRNEYLHTLQVRSKWTKNSASIEQGTIVLLMKDNVAPLRWPLGVVEKNLSRKRWNCPRCGHSYSIWHVSPSCG